MNIFQSLVQYSSAFSVGSELVCESDMDPRGVVGPTECERAIAPDEVTLSCSLTYNGNNAPRMIWSKAGDSPTLNNTHCVNIYKRVTCNTTLTANLQVIGSAYICEVTIQQYNCSLEINNILCKSRNFSSVFIFDCVCLSDFGNSL